MRVTIQQLLTKLGIEQELESYETIPLDYFNADKGTDFTAHVAMSSKGQFVDAEIQMINTDDKNGKPVFRLIFAMRGVKEPSGQYAVKTMRIMGKTVSGTEKNWFENGCRFFKLCTSHIKKGIIPDFDALYKASFGGTTDDGNKDRGSGGSRNFKNDKPPPKPPKPMGKF